MKTERCVPHTDSFPSAVLHVVKIFGWASAGVLTIFAYAAHAHLIDNTQATNNAKAGINKSLTDEIGAGRGDIYTENSSRLLIDRDPFRAKPLWGVGTSAPYGHDGRSISLAEVILRHGEEARASRDAYAEFGPSGRGALLEFLGTLVLFPPDDTASTLDPGNRNATDFPQFGHGSIKLTVLFNDPTDIE